VKPPPTVILVIATLAGCGNGVDGHAWAIQVDDAHDDCHSPPEDYRGPLQMDYVVTFDGAAVTLFFDDETFASGTIAGCAMNYESVVWDDAHNGFDVRWRLIGQSTWRTGEAGGCDLPEGTDWVGTETFEIIDSNEPELPEGCTYTIDLLGTYQGGPE
jgi:hypothetical protein